MPVRFCADCQRNHPLAAFGRNSRAKGGLHYYCKVCAATRQRAWAAANTDKIQKMKADYLKRLRAENAGRDPHAR